MTVFPSSKSIYLLIMLWAVVVSLPLPFLFSIEQAPWQALLIGTIVTALIEFLLLWILLDSRYRISDGKLYYYSGPFRGSILIDSIRKVKIDDSVFKTNTLKPGLDSKGLVIYYNKFDDIFISPVNREEFIRQLLIINPAIVTEK